jgi:hypothetical protein
LQPAWHFNGTLLKNFIRGGIVPNNDNDRPIFSSFAQMKSTPLRGFAGALASSSGDLWRRSYRHRLTPPVEINEDSASRSAQKVSIAELSGRFLS